LAKVDVLVLDDWGMTTFTDTHGRDLLEVVDDRYQLRSIIIAGQVPVEHWHELLPDPTVADAILDRLVHNAYKITLKGESMRKVNASLNQNVQCDI